MKPHLILLVEIFAIALCSSSSAQIVGDSVEAFHSGFGWKRGTVIKTKPDSWQIHYDDAPKFSKFWVKAKHIRLVGYGKGETANNTLANNSVEGKGEQTNAQESRIILLDIDNIDFGYGVGKTKAVVLGNQQWINENLNVDHFANGDLIPHAQTDEEWKRASDEKRPAWCYYNNDSANEHTYGKLYNWYAVIDRRGLAPAGWHIPSDTEWKQLTEYLGGAAIAGNKMKSSILWEKSDKGDNSSGFAAPPGGVRSVYLNKFIYMGRYGYWWSSSGNKNIAHSFNLSSFDVRSNMNESQMGSGLSVRCIRVLDSNSQIQVSNQKKLEGVAIYKDSIVIKGQVWSSKNLDVSHFRNGDEIPAADGYVGFEKAFLDRSPCYIQDGQWGKLYNYWAVNDPRGLAPLGWHIPTKKEWGLLMNNLGGDQNFTTGRNNGLVTLLKSEEGWDLKNGNNISGFSAFPAGIVDPQGINSGRGTIAYWWTSSLWNHENFWYVGLGDMFKKNSILSLYMDAGYGCSVRVVKGELETEVDYKLQNFDAPDNYMPVENAIDKKDLVLKNGEYFQRGSEVPFSGVVKGIVNDNNSNVFELMLFQEIKNGKANGDSTTWYSWHRKKYVASYINGKKEGLESMWDFDGNKIYEVNNKDGKREGKE